MLGYLLGIPLMILLAVLQSSVVSEITLLEGQLDLILVTTVAWSLAGRSKDAMVLGLIGGLLLDLLSGMPFGSTAIIYVGVLFLTSLLEGQFWGGHLLLPPAITLLASLLVYSYQLGMLYILGRQVSLAYALPRVVLPSTLLNILFALPVYHLLTSLFHRLFPAEVQI